MSKSTLLENKVIVVAGGSGLIGKAILSEALSQGATVVNIDVVPSKINDVEEYMLDITIPENINSTLQQIKSKSAYIHGLINCSYPRTKNWSRDSFESMPLQEWRDNVDLHMNSYYYLSQQVLTIMKQQGFGSLLKFASIYGVVGNNFNLYEDLNMYPAATYSAIKGGIINFTRYLAAYYAKDGIRVNAICPGGIYNNQPAVFVKKYAEKTPMGRMGLSEEIAGPVIFLASEASSYITGHILMVDGGWTVW